MFFAMLVMFFIMMKVSCMRRRHFAYRHLYHHPQHFRPRMYVREPEVKMPPRANAFEELRTRYVQGDIDVEQYEQELDALLRSPEGRKDVP